MFNFSNDQIIYQKKEDMEYIQFKKLLKYGVKHAYTLKGENLDFSHDSTQEKNSYARLAEALEMDKTKFVKPIQTHTSVVKCIDKVMESQDLQDVDGLITNQKDVILTTKNADCILFLFYDPVKKVIANVHSGWRGTFQKIAEKAVVKMINSYGCKSEDILCFICPSIRKCHFEVSLDVKELCANIFKFTGRTEHFIELGRIVDGDQKYNIDTVAINRILLLELGIKEKNIIDCNLCSVCNGDKIESVRVDGDNAGRGTAIIVL